MHVVENAAGCTRSCFLQMGPPHADQHICRQGSADRRLWPTPLAHLGNSPTISTLNPPAVLVEPLTIALPEPLQH
eukprot:191277-Chlamydomonas_euryale.AAC.2